MTPAPTPSSVTAVIPHYGDPAPTQALVASLLDIPERDLIWKGTRR